MLGKGHQSTLKPVEQRGERVLIGRLPPITQAQDVDAVKKSVKRRKTKKSRKEEETSALGCKTLDRPLLSAILPGKSDKQTVVAPRINRNGLARKGTNNQVGDINISYLETTINHFDVKSGVGEEVINVNNAQSRVESLGPYYADYTATRARVSTARRRPTFNYSSTGGDLTSVGDKNGMPSSTKCLYKEEVKGTVKLPCLYKEKAKSTPGVSYSSLKNNSVPVPMKDEMKWDITWDNSPPSASELSNEIMVEELMDEVVNIPSGSYDTYDNVGKKYQVCIEESAPTPEPTRVPTLLPAAKIKAPVMWDIAWDNSPPSASKVKDEQMVEEVVDEVVNVPSESYDRHDDAGRKYQVCIEESAPTPEPTPAPTSVPAAKIKAPVMWDIAWDSSPPSASKVKDEQMVEEVMDEVVNVPSGSYDRHDDAGRKYQVYIEESALTPEPTPAPTSVPAAKIKAPVMWDIAWDSSPPSASKVKDEQMVEDVMNEVVNVPSGSYDIYENVGKKYQVRIEPSAPTPESTPVLTSVPAAKVKPAAKWEIAWDNSPASASKVSNYMVIEAVIDEVVTAPSKPPKKEKRRQKRKAKSLTYELPPLNIAPPPCNQFEVSNDTNDAGDYAIMAKGMHARPVVPAIGQDCRRRSFMPAPPSLSQSYVPRPPPKINNTSVGEANREALRALRAKRLKRAVQQ